MKPILDTYKKNFFPKWWNDEKYKWESVKCFQDNWNDRANDFADMLTRSFAQQYNLLAGSHSYPLNVIVNMFAKNEPEFTREMFVALFDESIDVWERIKKFKSDSDALLKEYGTVNEKHHQNENSITTYLWFRYPDKYYIYKFSYVKKVGEVLNFNYKFKIGKYEDNIKNFYKLYDEICVELKKETEIVDMVKSRLTKNCYPDPKLKTLTQDVGFFIFRNYDKLKILTN